MPLPRRSAAKPSKPRSTSSRSASAGAAKAKAGTPKNRRLDWEAIERDFRTGKFTLRELEAKHGAGYADISRRAKASGWSKDLRSAVKAATSAAVIAETTKRVTTKAQQQTTDVVVAAAEINKQVILGHRDDIKKARNLAFDLFGELAAVTHGKEELELLFESVTAEMTGPALAKAQERYRELTSLHSRFGSMHRMAETLTKLQTLERRAFSLDDDDANKPGSLGEELAGFLGELHGSNAGSLPFVSTPKR